MSKAFITTAYKQNNKTEGFTPSRSPGLLSQGGFTLLELLVVIAIVGITSGSLVVNHRFGARQAELRGAADQIVSLIRRGQNATLAGTLYGSTVAVDHRISFSTSTPTTVRLCYNTAFCDSNVVETLTLSGGVTMTSIVLETFGATTRADIIFTSPYGDVTFVGNGFSSEGQRTLAVTITNPVGETKTIRVDPVSAKITVQ